MPLEIFKLINLREERNGMQHSIPNRDGIGPLEIALRNPNVNIVYKLVCAGAKLKHTVRPYYRDRLTKCLKDQSLTYRESNKTKESFNEM